MPSSAHDSACDEARGAWSSIRWGTEPERENGDLQNQLEKVAKPYTESRRSRSWFVGKPDKCPSNFRAGFHMYMYRVYEDLPHRKLVFNGFGYFVSPSERAQAQRPINPLEIIISAMWIASEGFLGSPWKLKRCSISFQVEVPLNWSIPQLICPLESVREIFRPWDSHCISLSRVEEL